MEHLVAETVTFQATCTDHGGDYSPCGPSFASRSTFIGLSHPALASDQSLRWSFDWTWSASDAWSSISLVPRAIAKDSTLHSSCLWLTSSIASAPREREGCCWSASFDCHCLSAPFICPDSWHCYGLQLQCCLASRPPQMKKCGPLLGPGTQKIRLWSCQHSFRACTKRDCSYSW